MHELTTEEVWIVDLAISFGILVDHVALGWAFSWFSSSPYHSHC